MPRHIVVCNWKMNPVTEKEAVQLFRATEEAAAKAKNVQVVVAAPFLHLPALAEIQSKTMLAGQNAFWEDEGAFTGEVSGAMLKSAGAEYVIFGHSERRQFLKETSEMVSRKVKKAFSLSLHPIVCIGEDERDGDEVPARVGEELRQSIAGISGLFMEPLIIAYEPLWAIGAGNPDTPHGMHKAGIYIRKVLAETYGEGAAARAEILYGGSVTSQNAAAFLQDTGGIVKGVLVGGASLDAREIAKIIETLNEVPVS